MFGNAVYSAAIEPITSATAAHDTTRVHRCPRENDLC